MKNIANRKSCNGCFYYMKIRGLGQGTTRGCHYMLITGKKRPCPAENCTEYTPKRKRHRYDYNFGDFYEEEI